MMALIESCLKFVSGIVKVSIGASTSRPFTATGYLGKSIWDIRNSPLTPKSLSASSWQGNYDKGVKPPYLSVETSHP